MKSNINEIMKKMAEELDEKEFFNTELHKSYPDVDSDTANELAEKGPGSFFGDSNWSHMEVDSSLFANLLETLSAELEALKTNPEGLEECIRKVKMLREIVEKKEEVTASLNDLERIISKKAEELGIEPNEWLETIQELNGNLKFMEHERFPGLKWMYDNSKNGPYYLWEWKLAQKYSSNFAIVKIAFQKNLDVFNLNLFAEDRMIKKNENLVDILPREETQYGMAPGRTFSGAVQLTEDSKDEMMELYNKAQTFLDEILKGVGSSPYFP